MIPKVLKDIENYLKNYQIDIHENVEGEGRGGSLNDEGTIKRVLSNSTKFKNHIFFYLPTSDRYFSLASSQVIPSISE